MLLDWLFGETQDAQRICGQHRERAALSLNPAREDSRPTCANALNGSRLYRQIIFVIAKVRNLAESIAGIRKAMLSNRYVSYQMAMGIVGAIIFIIFLLAVMPKYHSSAIPAGFRIESR